MKLLVIRHGVAEDRDRFARKHGKDGDADDTLRPLTPGGRRKMRGVARGLHRLVPHVDLLATSPLTRAAQTADIVAAAYHIRKRVDVAQLAPEAPVTTLLKWLQEQDAGHPDATVALVGHEPQLGVFVSWMLTGLQESHVQLKKGGTCLLRCKTDVKPGRATLLWLLKPSQLRGLGE